MTDMPGSLSVSICFQTMTMVLLNLLLVFQKVEHKVTVPKFNHITIGSQ